MRMGQCSCGILQSAPDALRLTMNVKSCTRQTLYSASTFFNTSVEIPLRNSWPAANQPLFMRSFPLCTGRGATLDGVLAHAFIPARITIFVTERGMFSTHVWKIRQKIQQSTFHLTVMIGSPPLCTIPGAKPNGSARKTHTVMSDSVYVSVCDMAAAHTREGNR